MGVFFGILWRIFLFVVAWPYFAMSAIEKTFDNTKTINEYNKASGALSAIFIVVQITWIVFLVISFLVTVDTIAMNAIGSAQ
jgi:hypothetical protein